MGGTEKHGQYSKRPRAPTPVVNIASTGGRMQRHLNDVTESLQRDAIELSKVTMDAPICESDSFFRLRVGLQRAAKSTAIVSDQVEAHAAVNNPIRSLPQDAADFETRRTYHQNRWWIDELKNPL